MVLNLMIDLLTPPFGMILCVLTDIVKISFERVMKTSIPFLIPLFLVTFIPDLVLFLVNIVLELSER